MKPYANLRSPVRIGNVEIKNRIVMSPMGDGLSTNEGNVTDRMIAYYSERAKGGAGLIIVGTTCVEAIDDGNKPDQHRIYREEHIKGLRRLSDALHRYDTRCFVQLFHAGLQGNPAVIGHTPYGVCTIKEEGNPKAIGVTEEQIEQITDNFINAASLCQRGGIDGVEIHAGHGYLLYEFLSRHYNKREDQYGGSLENRVRFLKKIVKGIRQRCGVSYPISVRISAVEPGVENGITMEEVCSIAKICEDCGVSMIDVSAGTGKSMYVQSANAAYPLGLNIPYAETVKKAVNIPVGVVGRIRDFEMAEQIITDEKADMVFFGRPFLIDPYFPLKAKEGQEDQARICLSCGTCHNTNKLGGIKCSLNPALQREEWYKDICKNGYGRKIVVIGGGPSGCEAARVFAMRGFDVTLLEKDKHLGGQVKLAAIPPDKGDMNNLEKYYSATLKALSVDVRVNTKADISMVRKLQPCAVVLAAGSIPIIPDVPGIRGQNVTTAESLLAGEYDEPQGENILVIGIGDTGMETAKWLMKRKNNILMADMLEEPKVRLLRTGQWKYEELEEEGVPFYKGHALKEIKKNSAIMHRSSDNTDVELVADIIVLSLGVRPNIEMKAELEKEFENVLAVGNVNKTGPIYESVADAFNTAWNFDVPVEYV